jgi:DNA-binding MarR family transcriptional regulator
VATPISSRTTALPVPRRAADFEATQRHAVEAVRAVLGLARRVVESLQRSQEERSRRDPRGAWRHGLLSELERLGGARMDDLIEAAVCPRRLLPAVLDQLLRDRLVECDQSALPRRERLLRLTGAGRAALERARHDEAARIAQALGTLPPQALTDAALVLRRLHEAGGRAGV